MDKFNSRIAFIQNRCQIYLYEKYKTMRKMQDFSWQNVSKIVYYANDSQICCICLDELILPRMDKCGHLFCLSCILNWLEITKGEKVLCPLCKDVEINVNSIKRVVMSRKEVVKVGESVQLKLLVKGGENVCPRFAEELSEYKDNILPKKGSSISEYVGVVVERDYNVIGSIRGELGMLKRRPKKLSGRSLERIKEHLSEEMKRFENWIRIVDREEVIGGAGGGGKAMSSCEEKFNLLEHERMADRFKLFYQCEGDRFVYLEGSVQEEMFAAARNTGQTIPVYLRGEIIAIRSEVVDEEFVERSRMNHLFAGAKLTFVSIDLDVAMLGMIERSRLSVLLAHQEELRRVEQEELELRRAVAKRAAETRNSKAPCRILRRNTTLMNTSETRDLRKNKINEIVDGFNTCTLGIECLVPDDYYPHAESCVHYNKDKIADSLTNKENEGDYKYFGLLRYKLNVFRGNEEIYPIVEEATNEKHVKHCFNYPPELFPLDENGTSARTTNNMWSYIVPNKPQSQFQQKQLRKNEKFKSKMS